MNENESDLSASEQAYFESGGESEVVATPETPAQPETPVTPEDETTPAVEPERDEKGKFVPHQALHQEREEHKKTKAQLEARDRQKAILEDRWNTLLKLQEKPPAEEQPAGPPDPEQDMFGYMKWQADQIQSLKSETENQKKQAEQQRQIEQQESEIWTHWQQSAQTFASATPEFNEAALFLADIRDKQLAGMAFVNPELADKKARDQIMNQELRAIIVAAKQNGINPAQAVFDLAKNVYGFAPKPPPGTPQLPDNLAQIDRAQRASQSLTATNGKAGGDPISAEAIAAMSPDEFSSWVKKPENERLFNKMLGG